MKSLPHSPIQQPRLYEMVAERIQKDYVDKAEIGAKLPTETEFSEMYKVSVPTVREALRSLVQTGHLRRRQGSGTYKSTPVSNPGAKTSKNSQTVAIITPIDLADGGVSCFYIQTALQTSKCLRQLGLPSQVYFGETAPDLSRSFDERWVCADIESGKVSAAVIVGESQRDDLAYIQTLAHRNIPMVRPDLTFSATGEPRLENFLKRAVDSLMQHGRRKIACIGFGADAGVSHKFDFRKIVAERGGITDDSWIIGDLHPSTSGSGYSLMREVWTTGKIKPDGLVLCDDIFFPDTAMAIQELGIKSPEQLLIVTYRNKGERLRALFPFIEIQYDARELASQMASNVVEMLQGRPVKPLISEPVVVNPLLAEDAESFVTT